MASVLGTDLERIAVAHPNTEHPHVHIAIRGIAVDIEGKWNGGIPREGNTSLYA